MEILRMKKRKLQIDKTNDNTINKKSILNIFEIQKYKCNYC